HVPRRLVFDLQWKTMEAQIGSGQRNPSEMEILILRRAADQNVVPIDLQIGCDANPSRSLRQFLSQVGSHRPSASSRETHVIDNPNPLGGCGLVCGAGALARLN